ncbi:NRDE family protein [Candidatus Uhrbacteria bacterium]|nr:NRDE family protein [Candidatus Uhrbacteria bacterium]
MNGTTPEIVLAANRDERMDRPSARPLFHWEGGVPVVLMPRDLIFGGTWIGLNVAGVIVALTNRDVLAPDRRRTHYRSRGFLTRDALNGSNAGQAAHSSVVMDHYRPFHLVAADTTETHGAWILAQDRSDCAPSAHGHKSLDHPLIITEQSYGAGPNRRARRIARALKRIGPNPTDAQFRKVLSMHDRAHPFDGACVHTKHDGRAYGTRSSTIIRITPTSFRYLHAEGPPCTTPYKVIAEGTFEDWRMGRLGKIMPTLIAPTRDVIARPSRSNLARSNIETAEIASSRGSSQ